MTEIDSFASELLEQSRAFCEKGVALGAEGSAYLHASLMLGFCSLEAHINAISDDYKKVPKLSLVDQSILLEREIKIEHGKFKLGSLKIYRLEDRILHLHSSFGTKVDRSASWWSELTEAINVRNRLTHPRSVATITSDQARRSLMAIVNTLQETYQSLYHRPFPSAGRGIQSRLTI